jgi:hypothetical protein
MSRDDDIVRELKNAVRELRWLYFLLAIITGVLFAGIGAVSGRLRDIQERLPAAEQQLEASRDSSRD